MPPSNFLKDIIGLFNPAERRRERVRRAPFPPEWGKILEARVPAVRGMSPGDRAKLQGHALVFLAEKRFEGCAGLNISDEIRLTIAVEACRLILGWDRYIFPRLHSILVYPREYVGRLHRPLPDGTVVEGPEIRHGESWPDGSVVLAWDAVRRGVADIRDGYNVVLHEFAHQIDVGLGVSEEWPPPEVLPHSRKNLAGASFRAVMAWEYDRLVDAAEFGAKTVLDPYGAESPAEFFAVATECFFEKGAALRRRHPELYRHFRTFYNQDPAAGSGSA